MPQGPGPAPVQFIHPQLDANQMQILAKLVAQQQQNLQSLMPPQDF
jgi:hypothetical protein